MIFNFPHNAPSFIGRQSELYEFGELLMTPGCRLLTVTGLGGIGKTNLALALGQQLQEHFPDGIYFVPLQSLQSSEQILPAIIAPLNIQISHNPRQQLLSWLYDKHLLLILDNFEHILSGVELVTEILDAAPDIKLLITSREALQLRTEWQRQLRGLDYPQGEGVPAEITSDAVALFIERANQQRQDVDLSDAYPDIVKICQMVEGMPLALELAAGWIRSLSCQQIADKLSESLNFLKSRHHDIPSRHRSMRIVFNTSWRMLTEEEQAVLCGLSVFRGGCTLQAIQAVTGVSLPVLTALVEKSFIRHDASLQRYDIHELLRQYADEKLQQSSIQQAEILDHHCTYYTDLLHQEELNITRGKQAHLLFDLDNLRMAWQYAITDKRVESLQRASSGLMWIYHFQNIYDEPEHVFRLAEVMLSNLPQTDDNRICAGTMWMIRCWFTRRLGKLTHMNDIDSALALWEGLEERPEMIMPLSRVMLIMMGLADFDVALAFAERVLTLSIRYDDRFTQAIVLATRAVIIMNHRGHLDRAQQLLDEAIAIDREIDFGLNARWAESNLARISSLQGRYRDAKIHIEASIGYYRTSDLLQSLTFHLYQAGITVLELEEDTKARAYFEECIEVASQFQDKTGVLAGKASLASLDFYEGGIASTTSSPELIDEQVHQIIVQLDNPSTPDPVAFLAMQLEYNKEALAYYEAMLSRQNTSNQNHITEMLLHSWIGQLHMRLNDEAQAVSHLIEALQYAIDMGADQVLTDVLLGLAQLSVVPSSLTAALLTRIHTHPASSRYSRMQAEQHLNTLPDSMTEADFAVAQTVGRDFTLMEAVSQIKPYMAHYDSANTPESQGLIDSLSKRELEVLILIAAGHSNREIAAQLHIAVSTVKKHINHIYDKLEVKNRTSAVARARTLKILP